MAAMAVDEQCVKFAGIHENNIYFEDYESDNFFKGGKYLTKTIQNNNAKFLVADEECLRFEVRNNIQRRKEDCLFNICCYLDSEPSSGLPVILKVSDNGKDRIVCTHDNGNEKGVYAKQLDLPLPDYIEGSHHEAVFFLQIVKERRNCYRMKSSLWPDWFLAFETKQDGLVKLVLREAGVDAVDEFKLLEP